MINVTPSQATPKTEKPFLNGGCGRIILPMREAAPNWEPAGNGFYRPFHHGLVDPDVYQHEQWVNADRNNSAKGVTQVDLFRYFWPFADNQFGGALLTHLVEHIPHVAEPVEPDWTDTNRNMIAGDRHPPYNILSYLANRQALHNQYQDGWYAFFSELYRVCEHGAIIHILSPYGWSDGAITDPTHTRYLTENTFTHSMQPDANSPFEYATGGINFQKIGRSVFRISPMFEHIADDNSELQRAVMTRLNVAYEFYTKLQVIKE